MITQGDFLVHFMDIARDELAKKPDEVSVEKLQVYNKHYTLFSLFLGFGRKQVYFLIPLKTKILIVGFCLVFSLLFSLPTFMLFSLFWTLLCVLQQLQLILCMKT